MKRLLVLLVVAVALPSTYSFPPRATTYAPPGPTTPKPTRDRALQIRRAHGMERASATDFQDDGPFTFFTWNGERYRAEFGAYPYGPQRITRATTTD